MSELWSRLIARHPRVLSALIAALSALAAWAALGLEFDDVARGIFRTKDAEFERLEQLFVEFGSDDLDCLLLLELTDAAPAGTDWFTREHAQSLRSFTAALEAVPRLGEVLALDRVPLFDGGLVPRTLLPGAQAEEPERQRARELAAAHPLVAGQLLSEDARATLVVARLAEGTDSVSDVRPIVSAVHAELEALEARAPVRARLTGIPPIRVEIFDVVQQDNLRQITLSAVLGTIVSLLLLRNLRALLATSGPAILGALWSLACVRVVDGDLDILNVILPPVVMVIGLTDAMHLVMRMRELRAEGRTRVEAAAESVRVLGLPCLLTSLTTAVGFGSLCVSRLDIIAEFGLTAAASVGLTFVAVLSLSPLVGRWAKDLGRADLGPAAWGGRWATRVADRAIDHAGWVSAFGVLLLLACSLLATRLNPDNRLTEATPRDRATFQALQVIDRDFGGSAFVGVLVEWEGERSPDDPELLRLLGEVRARIAATPPFAGALALDSMLELLPVPAPARLGLLRSVAPEMVERFVRADRGRALVRARMPDLSSVDAEVAADRLEAELDELAASYPDFRLGLTGTTIVARRNIDAMILDLALGLAAAAGIIVVVIAVALRSWRLGLLSILPNAFPLACVAAVLVLSGQRLQVVSAVSFTILLAVAVDDTIHVLSAFQRARARGDSPPEAARRASAEVSAAIVVTTLILVVGFSVLFVSEVPTNRTVALVCCLGFPAALVGDLLLLPALLALSTGGRGSRT